MDARRDASRWRTTLSIKRTRRSPNRWSTTLGALALLSPLALLVACAQSGADAPGDPNGGGDIGAHTDAQRDGGVDAGSRADGGDERRDLAAPADLSVPARQDVGDDPDLPGEPPRDAGESLDLPPDGPHDASEDPDLPPEPPHDAGAASDLTPDPPPDAGPDLPPDPPEDAGVEPEPPEQVVARLDPFVRPAVEVLPRPLVPGGQATIIYRGPLAGEGDLTVHYGFNGWNEVRGIGPLEQADNGQGDIAWFLERQMQRGPDGDSYQVVLDLPDDGRALHMAFHWVGGDEWDSREGLDYSGSFRFPYIGPFLTFDDLLPPSQGALLHWETVVPCRGVVEYGATPDLGRFASGAELGRLHHVALPLEGAQELYYRVYDSAGQVSELYRYQAPSRPDDELAFVALADMQENGESPGWAAVAADVVARNQAEQFAFVLLAGDMPADDNPGAWWTFFERGRELFASVPLVPAVGNHDTPTTSSNSDTSSYERYFDQGTVYSVDVGLVHVLCLDSERPEQFVPGGDGEQPGEQYVFAREDLERNAAARGEQPGWTFAAWHIPPYHAGDRHAGSQGSFRDITEHFDGVVDWVFTGHSHLYQRIRPMRYNATLAPSGRYGRGPEDGVGYLVVPSAGAYPSPELVGRDSEYARYRDRLAYPTAPADSDEVPTELGYVTVRVTEQELHLRTWGLGSWEEQRHEGHLRDEVRYGR